MALAFLLWACGVPQFDYSETGSLASAGPPVEPACAVESIGDRPWIGTRIARPSVTDEGALRLDDEGGEVALLVRCGGPPALHAALLASAGTRREVEVQYQALEAGHVLIVRDTDSFGPALAAAILFADALNAPLPLELAIDLRVERGPVAMTEVLAQSSGCTLAWDHIRVGLISEARAEWLMPGEHAVMRLDGDRADLALYLHAAAAMVGSPGPGCPSDTRTAWSLIRRDESERGLQSSEGDSTGAASSPSEGP